MHRMGTDARGMWLVSSHSSGKPWIRGLTCLLWPPKQPDFSSVQIKKKRVRCWWLKPVILATWEAEMRWIMV
jgi:hypothetical protein